LQSAAAFHNLKRFKFEMNLLRYEVNRDFFTFSPVVLDEVFFFFLFSCFFFLKKKILEIQLPRPEHTELPEHETLEDFLHRCKEEIDVWFFFFFFFSFFLFFFFSFFLKKKCHIERVASRRRRSNTAI
jgi:hypothetical protein